MRLRIFFALLYLCALVPVAFAADMREQEEVQEPDSEGTMPETDMQAPGDPTISGEQYTPLNAIPATPPVTSVTVPAAPKPPSDSGDTNFDTVTLQGLNKVTAHAQPIEASIGSVIRFGTIEIIAHKCWKSSPEDRPENAALLEVSEIKQGEAPQRIFSGWMFSSTPALSSLEHPFYDINVIACSKTDAKP